MKGYFISGRRVFLLITLFLFAASLVPSLADAALLRVGTGPRAFRTVVAAVAVAKSGDTICIAPGTYTGHVAITTSLTLIGANPATTILDGGGTNRVVTISKGAAVTIMQLTVRNGCVTATPEGDAAGGGIHSMGALVLFRSIVTGNRIEAGHPSTNRQGGQAWGGGIYSSGKVAVVCSRIESNVAWGGSGSYDQHIGGAGGASLGGGIFAQGTALILGSYFTGNEALGGYGNGGDGGDASGGGAYQDSGRLTVRRTIFEQNAAIGGLGYGGYGGVAYGGGLGNEGHAVARNVTLQWNNATGGQWPTARRYGYGGGIYNAGRIDVIRCLADGNTSSRGGAVANDGEMRLQRVSVFRSMAEEGGGIYNGAALKISDSSVAGNSCVGYGNYPAPETGYGGGVYNAGTCEVVSCSIDSNSAAGGEYYYSVAPGIGGGIFNSGVLTLLDSTVSRNLAEGRCTGYGAGRSYGGGLYNSAAGVTTGLNATFSANLAASSAGSHQAPAYGRGGGVYNQGGITMIHCTLVTNGAFGGGGGAGHGPSTPPGDGYGGGLYLEAPAYLANTIVADNRTSMGAADLFGPLVSGGYNLIEATDGFTVEGNITGNLIGFESQLSPLSNNGGNTLTHSPLPGSPAIDSGSVDGLRRDQRNVRRPYNVRTVPNVADGSDIGAVEFRPGNRSSKHMNRWRRRSTPR